MPVWILFLVLIAPAPLWAWQSLEGLQDAAQRFALVQAGPGAQVGPAVLDPRLRLPACTGDLIPALLARTPASITVALRCAQPAWGVHVPLRLLRTQELVVLARPVVRGQSLAAEDLRLESRDTASLSQAYVTDLQSVLGRRSARSLPAGSLLSVDQLQIERLVKRGQAVILVARQQEVEVRMGGQALHDASLGERVQVKNQRSGKVIEGLVQASGVVLVGL